MATESIQFALIATITSVIFSVATPASVAVAIEIQKQASTQDSRTQKQSPIQRVGRNVKTHHDVVYATVNDKKLLLDLYVPETRIGMPPLLVWIHGGGWRKGSKDSCKLTAETTRGYAVASLNYRLSQDAIFPAQIHDCKGAIRWLRANAKKYGYNADRIGVAGSSAGGQLVALLGTSGGIEELEGNIGGNLEQSSSVQAVCDFYGTTDFHLLRIQREKSKYKSSSSVAQLFGGKIQEKSELATLASAITFLDEKDPAFLIIHGAQDKIVPLQQSTSFEKLLNKVNVPVKLVILEDAGHGGKQFNKKEIVQCYQDFFDKHIKGKP